MAQETKAREVPAAGEDAPARRGWLGTRVSGLPIWGWIGLTLAVVAVVVGAGAWWTYGRGGRVPPVTGYYNGEEITFIHTEASDPQVAETLTGMKGSPVFVVPELSKVPDGALATVYVFTNGVKGSGPLGFQSDVFDSVPGDEGYSPLRSVGLVTWKQGADARVLDSAQEVREAASKGELRIEEPGVVVNMPLLEWPAGRR